MRKSYLQSYSMCHTINYLIVHLIIFNKDIKYSCNMYMYMYVTRHE